MIHCAPPDEGLLAPTYALCAHGWRCLRPRAARPVSRRSLSRYSRRRRRCRARGSSPPQRWLQARRCCQLVIERDALYDPASGLLTHVEERGREWERPGYISYFADGLLKLATRTGVRLHGGDSRIHSPTKSYRFYFRSGYGPPALPSRIFFTRGPGSDLTRVIAHNDMRRDGDHRPWHLVNPLAYDIAARLGGITPRTQPTRFYLNGEPQGVYVLTEQISPEFLEARFGHRDFSIQVLGDGLDCWDGQREPVRSRWTLRQKLSTSTI